MNQARFQEITNRYRDLKLAVIGDFCLDRYLEIEPKLQEISIETGLVVHNVVNVRSQPGGAGTILNNLVALGIGEIFAVGFCGDDGEGYELRRALAAKPRVNVEFFLSTPDRKTFTYAKPLVIAAGKSPEELNRLDQKNWSTTPENVNAHTTAAFHALISRVDAMILLDQVDVPETGAITSAFLTAVREAHHKNLIVADSRRGLKHFPPLCYKMNRAELARFLGQQTELDLKDVRAAAKSISTERNCAVFITMADEGMLAVDTAGDVAYVPSFPPRGEIDVVGAGDCVTANITAALASFASAKEALELASAAASIVIHQLGTTGTASIPELASILGITH